MRASEILNETISPESTVEMIHTARKYLTQMFSTGIADRSAVMSTIDVLHQRGADYRAATSAVKQAFTDIKGTDVTTESVFEGLLD